jgi:glycosyltransferase involved in cell wall biosynthesis
VVVPAFNEEQQISKVIEGMPDFVDKIVIINDCSKDKTHSVVMSYVKTQNANRPSEERDTTDNRQESEYDNAERVLKKMQSNETKHLPPMKVENENQETDRIILISHKKNAGKGASIATGYKWCRDNDIDCTATMDGDGQMDPSELESICRPIVEEGVDYTKGNRLSHRSAFFVVPKIRYFGNSILSLLTKIASGYWRVSDSQCGYTAISLKALQSIRIHKIYRSYGYPNDMLVKLNIAFCTIKEVDSKPVYDVGEKSKMKIWKVIPTVSFLLFKSFLKRLYVKYLFRDFHPLFLLYHLGFFLLVVNIPYIIAAFRAIGPEYQMPLEFLVMFTFLSITAFQSIFFAMWMDMMDNDRYQKN